MSERDDYQRKPIVASARAAVDEGGLHAPRELSGWRKAWWWFDFVILVNLARLRFVAILLLIGLIITQWDRLTAYYDKWTRSDEAAAGADASSEWFCPMHPAVVRDNPKEKCPICFMPLSKRTKGESHQAPLPAGVVNRLQLSPYRLVLGGVQTWTVDYQPLSKEISALGFIEFNERGQKTVSARFSGRIDKLFVNETGQIVAAGDKLAAIYSPDVVVTAQNLIDAKRGGLAKNRESAERRLALLGIEKEQLAEILASDQAPLDITIRSPIGGHIIKKYVQEGQYVEEGAALYDVADLSTVWIQAQIYEDDIEFLPLDQQFRKTLPDDNPIEITATTRAIPDETFHGFLTFVYPHVDQNTRTVTIRCEIENPGHKLRPGSTAMVTFKVFPKNLAGLVVAAADDPERAEMLRHTRMLAVPESSVIDTGAQTIVYRQTSPSEFEGVTVKLGPRMSGPNGVALYPVLQGLAAGDRIVTAGSFLVDAETRLNPAAGSVYFGGSSGSKDAKSAAIVRPSTPEDEGGKLQAALARLSPDDRKLAVAQQFCPVLKQNRLGVMGTPVKLTIADKTVFVCCEACQKKALADPKATLQTVADFLAKKDSAPAAGEPVAGGGEEAKIAAALSKLSPADRREALAQRFCAVLDDSRLGSMGKPVKLTIEGQTVFVCCDGCQQEALANAKATLARTAKLKKANKP